MRTHIRVCLKACALQSKAVSVSFCSVLGATTNMGRSGAKPAEGALEGPVIRDTSSRLSRGSVEAAGQHVGGIQFLPDLP